MMGRVLTTRVEIPADDTPNNAAGYVTNWLYGWLADPETVSVTVEQPKEWGGSFVLTRELRKDSK